MAASSVTGTGPGDSHGLQKPENHCGCGCCGPKTTPAKPAARRAGCFRRHVLNSGVVRPTAKGGAIRSNSCF